MAPFIQWLWERLRLPLWLSGQESASSAGESGYFSGSGGSLGRGHGSSLHCSYLKNPRDRVRHNWSDWAYSEKLFLKPEYEASLKEGKRKSLSCREDCWDKDHETGTSMTYLRDKKNLRVARPNIFSFPCNLFVESLPEEYSSVWIFLMAL